MKTLLLITLLSSISYGTVTPLGVSGWDNDVKLTLMVNRKVLLIRTTKDELHEYTTKGSGRLYDHIKEVVDEDNQ